MIVEDEDVLKLLNDETSNRNEAESFAMDAINSMWVPVISSRFSSRELEKGISESRKVRSISARIVPLTVITDQIIAAYVSPDLSMINFSADKMPSIYAERVAKEWNDVFKNINIAKANGNCKISKSCMESMLSFLQRQYRKLVQLKNENEFIAQAFLTCINKNQASDECFWNYKLVSIEGKCDPRPGARHTKIQTKMDRIDPIFMPHSDPDVEANEVPKGCGDSADSRSPSQLSLVGPPLPPDPSPGARQKTRQEWIDLIFGSRGDPDVEANEEPKSCSDGGDSRSTSKLSLVKSYKNNNFEHGPNSQEYKSGVAIPISSLKISSYLLPHLLQLETKIGNSFLGVLIGDEYLELTAKDLSAGILSPMGTSPALFLYLSAAGVLKLMGIIMKVPGIPHSVFNDNAPASKKLVFNISKLKTNVRNALHSTIRDKMKVENYVEVISTFGQLLSYGLVDYKRAFYDQSVRIMEAKVRVDFGSPLRSVSSSNESVEIVKQLLGEVLDDESFGMSSSERVVKTFLEELLENIITECTVGEQFKEDKRLQQVLQNAFQLNIDSGHSKRGIGLTSLFDQALNMIFIEKKSNIQSKLSSPTHPTIIVDGKEITFVSSDHKRLFDQLNGNMLRKTGISESVVRLVLKLKWNKMKPTKPSASTSQNPAKKIKLDNEKIVPRCLNNNIVKTEKKLPLKLKKEAVSVIDLTAEDEDEDDVAILKKKCKYLCDCDECKHVTAGHKIRSIGGFIKIKCRCHPCTIRTEVKEMGFQTDPFQVVKMKPDMTCAETLRFWTRPWLDNLFADIVADRLDLKTASLMIGSTVADLEKNLNSYCEKKRYESSQP